MATNKLEWVRDQLHVRLTGVSSPSKRKKIFKNTWKEAHRKFN